MALAGISTVERFGRGRFFLAARPSSDPGSDSTTRVQGYKALFYLAGDTGTTLKGGVTEYANLNSDGLSLKSKQNTIEYDPNNGPKHPIGISDTETELEFEFADVDPDHVADIFGLSASELISIAASTGKAGRKLALVGGQTALTQCVGCYQMPSPTYAGQFDNAIFPRLLLHGDVELKLNKKNALTMKVKATALPDTFLVNANGFGEAWVLDVVTAAAL